jgi:hypothetical protein
MFVIFVSLFACLTPKSTILAPEIPSESEQMISSNVVLDSWSGRVYEREAEKNMSIIIRDEQELSAFVATIPKNKIQRKNPAPPSEDPLLNDKKIDFTKEMMVVALRFDNMYAVSNITSVIQGEAGIVVHVQTPPVGESEMYASVMGIGTYSAVLIPKSAQPIRFAHTQE